jgi:predicted DNA-binding ribbon-helix-helix protein
MRTPIIKRSIVVAGHKTSVSLEDPFWDGLKEIGGSQEMTLSEVVGDINALRLSGNLSSAIRVFVLGHFQGQMADNSARLIASTQLPPGTEKSPQANGSAPP